ncbi:Dicer-like protein 1 [Rhodotorula kratochvilovae]
MAAPPPEGSKHCLPVQSALSPPSNLPPKESHKASLPLTSPQTRAPPISPEAAAAKKQKKRQAQRDRQSALPASDAGNRGRKSARPKKARKKGLPSQAAQFNKTQQRKGAQKQPPPQPQESFVPVKGDGGALAFTRPRGNALNSSIASVLGARRPADVLEEHDRETRTKRQKTAADEMRRRLLLDDEDEDDLDGVGELAVEKDRAQEADAEMGDSEEEDGDLLVTPIATAGQEAAASPPARASSSVDDPLAAYRSLPSFAPTKPFTFPQPQPTPETPKATFAFSFQLSSRDPPLAPTLHIDPVTPLDTAEAAPPSPSPAPLALSPSPAPPVHEVMPHAPVDTPTEQPFSELSKVLPLPTGALPKPDLRSAAAVLASKKRKPKKLRRAPKLFDYLSDEDSDDWEDMLRVSKRPKTGRAMDGKLQVEGGGEEADTGDNDDAAMAQAERLVPTSYQSALLERAKDGNLITVMPTGSGKTLIGVLLIEWINSTIETKRVQAGERKRMQFVLTQSVPLLHQQADVRARNTSLRVGKLFGALGVNLCSESEWKWNFEHYDCLVVTAQLILDSLAHGFLKMEQIALLVFDEAHHAKSNHPFASILRDFYHRAPRHKRPRILGLTASPLDSNAGVDEAKTLERLFDAKLVTAPPETQAELRAMVSVPTLLREEYDPAPTYEHTELFREVVSKVIVRDEVFDRYYAGAETALREYGPDAADLVWHLALQRHRRKFLPHEEVSSSSSEDSASEVERELLSFRMDKDVDEERKARAGERKEADRRAKARMKRELKQKMEAELSLELRDWLKAIDAHKPTLDEERLSPKLLSLLKILRACKIREAEFCGIIFVKRRLDALHIAQIIKELAKVDSELGWIRVDCVTGHGSAANNSLGPRMEWAEQHSILTSFGEGRSNLLIATSVVEEGLDVQPCNFICRFDLYDTHISFVQSRGRARSAGSHYVVFVERGNLEHKRKLLRIARFDAQMEGLLNREIEGADSEDVDDSDFFGRADETSRYLEEPTTGAVLTPHFSLSLLLRYCQSLPKSDEFSINKPQYKIDDFGRNEFGARQFSCTVALPSGSKVRVVTGGLFESAKLAKREAAYDACRVLRNVGCLDEHFLPPRYLPAEEVVDIVTGAVVGSKKRQVDYEKKLPEAFLPRTPCGEVTTLYASLVHYGGENGETTHDGQRHRPLVLFTRNPLPEVPQMTMYVRGEPLALFVTSIGSIAATTEQRKILSAYDLQLWQAVLNKMLRVAREEVDGNETLKELDLVYFLALLRDGRNLKPSGIEVDDVDWAGMERAARLKEQQIDWRDLSHLDDSVIVDLGKKGCRYNFQRVRYDLHPRDKLPPGRQSDAGFDTLMDYYLSFDEDGFFHTLNVKEEQPLLEITRMPKTVTHLTRTPRNDVSPSTKRLLQITSRFAIPQVCLLHFLPASVFRTAYMLPSIIHDLEQRCLVVELNERLFQSSLDHEYVRTALMTPSASVGLDYNRLELLGDAFLKYMASSYVYVSHDRDEGTLHRARLEQITNVRLYDSGKAFNLPGYLVSRPFTSRQFLPPNFTQLSPGPAPPTSAVIGDKTIADAVEALLGAAMETGYEQEDGGGLNKGFDLALEVAKALGLELGNVVVWDDFARLYGSPGDETPLTGELVAVEDALGYKFKHACEWLGDSILDFHVIRYCWKRWGGELSEGHLTELKGACVSNETLAALAVEHGLDRFLIHAHEGLELNMRLYRERIIRAREKELATAAAEQRQLRPYWLTLDPPKAVADIIESLFGALYLDAGFDPGAAQRAFDHMLAPFIAKWISPKSIKVDAIRVLLEHAQSSGCDDVSHVSAVLEPHIDNRTGELIQRLTRCSVVAHNMRLSTVESGNVKTAKRLASADALSYLHQNPSFFAVVCNCSTRRDVAREIALEEQQRLRDEGLLTEPDSGDDEDLGPPLEVAGATGKEGTGGGGMEGEKMAVDA